jgi:CheY-like chemotaxis protein
MAGLDLNGRINLEKASVLLLDANHWSQQICKQILFGFGVRTPFVCDHPSEAREVLETEEVNLLVISDTLPDSNGYEFVSWLRRSELDPNCFSPAIIVSGHTKRANIQAARDCGANFILAKPVSIQVMMERVIWVAREGRPFIDTGSYLGPDRRFHDAAPPNGVGRRRGDPTPDQALADAKIALGGAKASGSDQ